MTESTQKEKIDMCIDAAQRVLAEMLDSDLYIPMKRELEKHNTTHSLGTKKEMFKNKIECLFENLKKDLEDSTAKDRLVVDCAVAFMDLLNSFNDFNHPEVHKSALELQKAVGEYLKPSK